MYTEVADSGERSEFATGAVRDKQDGKGRFDLLPAHAMHRLARHFENGARKYDARNWENGIPLSRYLDSALRHIFTWMDGNRDEDHLIAAVWNLLCLVQTDAWICGGELPESLNDLPKHMKEV